MSSLEPSTRWRPGALGRRFGWTHLLPATLVVAMACGDSADPSGPPNTPPPNNPTPGFTLLTFLNGTVSNADENARDVAVDASGNVYVTGGTNDPSFLTTTGAYQRVLGQGQQPTSAGRTGNVDIFVMKFSPDGQLLWSTLLGGGNHDRAYAIEVDGSGVYLAGRAGEGFPTTPGVVQPAFAGDHIGSGTYGKQDGFIAKLSLDGRTLLWSTYFGAPADEFIRDLAIGPGGDVYPAVSVAKAFPFITAGAFQTTNRGSDGAVCRVASDARSVRWCTYIGGSDDDGGAPSIRLDGAGNVYYLMTSRSNDTPTSPGAFQTRNAGAADLHLSKFSPQGTFLFGTYFGGAGIDGLETHNLWVTASGEAFLASGSSSANLPTSVGAVQAQRSGTIAGFVARLSADGRQVIASTYFGGSGADEIEGVALDASGNVVVTGRTTSSNLPGVTGSPSGGTDAFIAVLRPDLTAVIRGTYVGGSGPDMARAVAVDGVRNVIYAVGITDSANFPTLGSGALTRFSGTDGFLAGWR